MATENFHVAATPDIQTPTQPARRSVKDIVNVVKAQYHWHTAPKVLREFTKGLTPIIPGISQDPITQEIHPSEDSIRSMATLQSFPMSIRAEHRIAGDTIYHVAQLYRSTRRKPREVRDYFTRYALSRYICSLEKTLQEEYLQESQRITKWLSATRTPQEALQEMQSSVYQYALYREGVDLKLVHANSLMYEYVHASAVMRTYAPDVWASLQKPRQSSPTHMRFSSFQNAR